jgi:hypothetical protein
VKKLLLAAALSAAFLGGSPAHACTLETCAGTSVVCTKVNCHVCYYDPPGYRCL